MTDGDWDAENYRQGRRKRRVRWRVANLLNRLHRTCWTDLASWANGTPTEGRTPLDLTAVTECRRAAARSGSCYCGKFMDRHVADVQQAAGHGRVAAWRVVSR